MREWLLTGWTDCGATTRWCDTEEQVRAAWNTRSSKKEIADIASDSYPRLFSKDLFFFRGTVYVRNTKTEFCYASSGQKYKRIKKSDYQTAYEECARAAGKVKE